MPLELLLFQELALHPLMHLKLIETTRIGGAQIVSPPDASLTQIEVQGVLLLLKLKRPAMRCHASLICRHSRECKARHDERERRYEDAVHG
jgi:hypothetical protein